MTLGEDFTREWLLETFPEVKTYPVVVVDDYNIGGYQQLNELLSRESKSSAKFLIEG
jgi:glutaredoxin